MGIIVNDNILLKYGNKKAQCYFNIGNEPIILNKNPLAKGMFNITTNFCIYYDIDSYKAGGDCIDKKSMFVSVQQNEISENLYELLYDKIKSDFSSYINI